MGNAGRDVLAFLATGTRGGSGGFRHGLFDPVLSREGSEGGAVAPLLRHLLLAGDGDRLALAGARVRVGALAADGQAPRR